MISTLHHPLSDDEFDELGAFLDSIGPGAMNLETLDGYFTALICGPELIAPSEHLGQIWGDEFGFATPGQAINITSLLMRHWNEISNELHRTLKEAHVYMPTLFVGEDGITRGNDWACGFMRGMRHADGWTVLIDSEEHGGPLVTIMLLAHEHDPDPAMRPPPVPDEKREDILVAMISGVTHIYRYFEPHRRAAPLMAWHPPTHRRRFKTGRNEPCPCGSGRKYKRCCGSDDTSLH